MSASLRPFPAPQPAPSTFVASAANLSQIRP
jgi:hypothetical protein